MPTFNHPPGRISLLFIRRHAIHGALGQTDNLQIRLVPLALKLAHSKAVMEEPDARSMVGNGRIEGYRLRQNATLNLSGHEWWLSTNVPQDD